MHHARDEDQVKMSLWQTGKQSQLTGAEDRGSGSQAGTVSQAMAATRGNGTDDE